MSTEGLVVPSRCSLLLSTFGSIRPPWRWKTEPCSSPEPRYAEFPRAWTPGSHAGAGRRRGWPWRRRPGARTASSADCGYRSPQTRCSGPSRWAPGAASTAPRCRRPCPRWTGPARTEAKSPAMTRPSERENTAWRTPPTPAQRGESWPATSPIRWSSSEPGPALCISFDSGEPRCSSQTVAKMYRKNCRYSDYQFSVTSTAKSEDVR
jgi:hypothetical protein